MMSDESWLREETISMGTLVWQSEAAKNYLCPLCRRWIRSQYEGDVEPIIRCLGDVHQLLWKLPHP